MTFLELLTVIAGLGLIGLAAWRIIVRIEDLFALIVASIPLFFWGFVIYLGLLLIASR